MKNQQKNPIGSYAVAYIEPTNTHSKCFDEHLFPLNPSLLSNANLFEKILLAMLTGDYTHQDLFSSLYTLAKKKPWLAESKAVLDICLKYFDEPSALRKWGDRNNDLINAYFAIYHCPKEYEYVESILKKWVEKSDPLAIRMLGDAHKYNSADSKRHNHAFLCYQRASELGNAQAMAMLAGCYYNGHGCEIDIELAYQYAEKSIGSGAVEGYHTLAAVLIKKIEFDQAEAVLIEGLNRGDINAFPYLGMLYDCDEAGKKNLKEAFKLYEQGAKLGCAKSMVQLWSLYGNQSVDEYDLSQSIKYGNDASLYYGVYDNDDKIDETLSTLGSQQVVEIFWADIVANGAFSPPIFYYLIESPCRKKILDKLVETGLIIDMNMPFTIRLHDEKSLYVLLDYKHRHISTLLTRNIVRKLNDYTQQYASSDLDDYSAKQSFYKSIYLWTKQQFDVYQDALTPQDKSVILYHYIRLWQDIQGSLCITDTDYAEQFQHHRFGKNGGGYNTIVPMLAGFNLKNICLSSRFPSDLIFPAVNFWGADFSECELTYASFNQCEFSASFIGSAILRQSTFWHCDLRGIDFTKADIMGVQFHGSLLSTNQQFLLDKGIVIKKHFFADIGIDHSGGLTFSDRDLLDACHKGDVSKVQHIIQSAPDLVTSSIDENKNTPLHVAVRQSHEQIIRILLRNGAKLDLINAQGYTPFRLLIRSVVLLMYGGYFPLSTFKTVVKQFQAAGIDLSNRYHTGHDYIQSLPRNKKFDQLRWLFEEGVAINVQNKLGNTVLHELCLLTPCKWDDQLSEKKLIRWMIQQGADLSIRNFTGATAFDLASSRLKIILKQDKLVSTGVINASGLALVPTVTTKLTTTAISQLSNWQLFAMLCQQLLTGDYSHASLWNRILHLAWVQPHERTSKQIKDAFLRLIDTVDKLSNKGEMDALVLRGFIALHAPHALSGKALEQEVNHLEQAAKEGHAMAWKLLGDISRNDGLSKNALKKARCLYEKSVYLGNPYAKAALAEMLYQGLGGKKNVPMARDYAEQSLTEGIFDALKIRSVILYDDHNIADLEADLLHGLNEGALEAYYLLADALMNKDFGHCFAEPALALLKQGARLGCDQAISAMYHIYLKGRECERSEVDALYYQHLDRLVHFGWETMVDVKEELIKQCDQKKVVDLFWAPITNRGLFTPAVANYIEEHCQRLILDRLLTNKPIGELTWPLVIHVSNSKQPTMSLLTFTDKTEKIWLTECILKQLQLFDQQASIKQHPEQHKPSLSSLYRWTKTVLDIFSEVISPIDKDTIVRAYIECWYRLQDRLRVQDTDPAGLSKEDSVAKLTKFRGNYQPMMAEFNLSNIRVRSTHLSNITFTAVDFSNADLTQAQWQSCSFNACMFNKKTLIGNANFTGSTFSNCNLLELNFIEATIDDVAFRDCQLSWHQTYLKARHASVVLDDRQLAPRKTDVASIQRYQQIIRMLIMPVLTGQQDTRLLKRILDHSPELVNHKDSQNNSPLHMAVEYGQQAVIDILLVRGADIGAKNDDALTPIGLFLKKATVGSIDQSLDRFIATLTSFINAGVNLNDAKLIDTDYLHWFIAAKQYEKLKALVSQGADLFMTDGNHNTLLHTLFADLSLSMRTKKTVNVIEQVPAMAKWLIKKGINPHAKNDKGLTVRKIINDTKWLCSELVVNKIKNLFDNGALSRGLFAGQVNWHTSTRETSSLKKGKSKAFFTRKTGTKRTIVFDIDGVLAAYKKAGTEARFFFLRQGAIINANGYSHYIFPGVKELLKDLIDNPQVDLAFISNGVHERNAPLIKFLLIEAVGKCRYKSIKDSITIISRHDLSRYDDIKALQQRNEQFGYQNELIVKGKKDICLALALGNRLSHALMIDDDVSSIWPGQEKHVLIMPSLKVTWLEKLLAQDTTDPMIVRKANSIYFISGVIHSFLEDMSESPSESIFNLQYHAKDTSGYFQFDGSKAIMQDHFQEKGLAHLRKHNADLQLLSKAHIEEVIRDKPSDEELGYLTDVTEKNDCLVM